MSHVCSVSALQWLFYNDKKDHRSAQRLNVFFTSLYRCLRRGARAALQIYPENAEQLELLTAVASRCGFTGGLVVDFPNSTKAKKYFLCLFAGTDPGATTLPKARGTTAAAAGAGDDAAADGTVPYESRRMVKKHKGSKMSRTSVKNRSWITAKKESMRARGQETRPDSKYTGRKRSGAVRF